MKLTSRQKMALMSSLMIAGGLLLNTCGKKKKDSDTESAGMTVAYPMGLSLSVAPQSSTIALADDSERERPLKEKKERLNKC
jgi:hypothetical protein